MASCERCGHALPVSAKFCDHCGNRHTTSMQAIYENALDRPEVRGLIQRAEELRAIGQVGPALDLIQEAGEHVGEDETWRRLEYSMRATIARGAVAAGGVGEPLPGTCYGSMSLLARIGIEPAAGPSVNPALLAMATARELIRVPSGAFTGRQGPLEGTVDELCSRGEARAVPLPELEATHVLCERQGGRVWVAGPRTDGQGHAVAVHDPADDWTVVIPRIEEAVSALELGGTGRRVAVGTVRGEVRLIDVEGGQKVVLGGRHLTREAIVRCGAAADGDIALAWAGRGTPVLLGPVVAAGQLRRLEVPHRDVTAVALAAGGRLVATIDEVGQLCFFRTDDARPVGRVHLPVLQDPELLVGGPDASHEVGVVRPGGNTLHCYEFHYLVFVGEPVHVLRTKPEKLPDSGRLSRGPFAGSVTHTDAGVVSVYDGATRPLSGRESAG